MWARTPLLGCIRGARCRRAALEPPDQLRDCQYGRVGDEQAHVVGLAVELDQLGAQVGADLAHGVLAAGEHGAGEHL